MMGREKARERDDWEILCRKVVSGVEKLCAVVSDAVSDAVSSPFPSSLSLPLPCRGCYEGDWERVSSGTSANGHLP